MKKQLRMGYSSFPEWSPLGEIIALEKERGNYVPGIAGLDPSWSAKWVADSQLVAYSYMHLARDSDRIRNGKLHPSERRYMEESVCRIPILGRDIILCNDGDNGYLIVRPPIIAGAGFITREIRGEG